MYLRLKEKPPKGYVVQEETDKKSSNPPDLGMCGLKYGPKLGKPLKREKSKNGQEAKTCKRGKRRKTGAKCAVHKDENCFLLDPT